MQEIIWLPKEKTGSLSEITQSLVLKFALLSKDNEQCHQLVKCRDFLHDVIKYSLTNEKLQIYGLKYDNTYPRVDTQTIRMVVELENNDESVIKYMLDLINFYELVGQYDFYSTAVKVANPQNISNPCYIFTGPSDWFRSPSLISLYTLLIKLGYYKINFNRPEDLEQQYKNLVIDIKTNEQNYLNTIYKDLYKIVLYSKYIFPVNTDNISTAFYSDLSTSTFHNNYGIVGLIKGFYSKIYFDLDAFRKGKINMDEIKEEVKSKPIIKSNKMSVLIDPDLKKDILATITSHKLYSSRNPLMGFVHKKEDGTRYLCTKVCTCRDYLNDMLINTVNKKSYDMLSETYPIDFKQLRLLVCVTTDSLKKQVMFAKKVINIIETYLNFPSKTKISTVKLEDTDIIALLLTGPKEWVKYSQILSIATLFIKGMCLTSATPLPKVETMADVYNKLFPYLNKGAYSSYTVDIGNFLPLLLPNFNELFTESIEQAYNKKLMYNFHSRGGIHYLATDLTRAAVSDEFKQLFKIKLGITE